VYDYLNDSWFDNSNVSQIRTELSYVWGYHEFGFWGAFNIGDQNTIFGPVSRRSGVTSTRPVSPGAQGRPRTRRAALRTGRGGRVRAPRREDRGDGHPWRHRPSR
jgi:hypothetical protein